jgi:N-acetylglutamate synthase-like GNAT family acetyltransferase
MVRVMDIRAVRPEEHHAAGELVVAAYRALPGATMSGGYAAELADVERRAAEAEVLVAVEGDALLGCVTFVPDRGNPWAEQLLPGEASIRMLAVGPDCQGRGVGRVLLEACVSRAVALGREAIFLHSTRWMQAAHHLYAQRGFVRVEDRDWVPMPGVELLAFRLDI